MFSSINSPASEEVRGVAVNILEEISKIMKSENYSNDQITEVLNRGTIQEIINRENTQNS